MQGLPLFHAPNPLLTCTPQVVMVDPVLLRGDGQSYERVAVADWLQQHGTSPLTGQPATADSLMPNFALRSVLQALARRC